MKPARYRCLGCCATWEGQPGPQAFLVDPEAHPEASDRRFSACPRCPSLYVKWTNREVPRDE